MRKNNITGLCVVILLAFVTGCDESKPTSMGTPPSSSGSSGGGGSATTPVVVDSILTRRNFFVVFDGSGSMSSSVTGGNKIDIAKRAVIEFAQSLKPEDNLGLVAFDTRGTSERVLLGTNNRDNFSQAINAISASGGTPLYESIEFAFARLKEQIGKQLDYGEYHIVVVTDGEASGRAEGDLVSRINQTPIVLHAIGFDIGEGHSLNQPGKTDYSNAQNPEELRKSLQGVLAESEEFGK